MYLLAPTSTQAALRGEVSRNTMWPVGGALGLLALILAGRLVPPTVTLGLAAAAVIAALVIGLHRRNRGAMPVADST